MKSTYSPLVAFLLFASLQASLTSIAAAELNPTLLRLSSPLDYQVYQRTERATGKIVITGTLPENSPDSATVEARLVHSWVTNAWQKVATVKPGISAFRGELTAAAGGWYRLEVRMKRGDIIAAETAVEHVGVGEVFIVAGQSNSANYGEEKQQTTTGLVAV